MTESIIRHCAPTLAGLKAAGMFVYSFDSELALTNSLSAANRLLRPKGLRAELLRARDGRALVWIYRPSMLGQSLSAPDVRAFLARFGYRGGLRDDVARLRVRLSCGEFPHEIGLFLGYPLHDVLGFIRHKGQNARLTGAWKVYENEDAAQKLFARYRKCSVAYIRLFLQGKPIERLIVSA